MKKIHFLNWLLIIIFGILFTRTIDLMLVRGAYYRDLAENNRIRRINIPAARGRILTSDGQSLAQNTVAYFDFDGQSITRQLALELEAEEKDLIKEWRREYPFGEITSHITGYLGEANQKEVASQDISLGSFVGRGGLEEYYDQWLRGEDGEKIIEVSVTEGTIRELGKKNPVAGEDLVISLDLDWQQAAWQALKGKKGAVVVIDPNNGSLLAISSYPSYDSNLFTLNRQTNLINQVLNDKDLPMLNRAIGGAYHPGSVFKMIPALAGLAEEVVDQQTEVEDTGYLQIGEWIYRNWLWMDHGRTDGMVNVVKAIKRSNDIYFYKLGEWLGMDDLVKWMEKFNLGQKTEVDLPGEVSGFVPTPEWKLKAKGERWFLGNTYHLSIGQGDLTTTPLQIALETAAIVNGGKICQPHLGLISNSQCQMLDVRLEHLELVKQGMIEACQPGGTAAIFNDFQPAIGCKTGTAQISVNSEDTHAWFTLFYPLDQPEVVITVLLERGGGGARNAAPVAKEIIQRYMGNYEETLVLDFNEL